MNLNKSADIAFFMTCSPSVKKDSSGKVMVISDLSKDIEILSPSTRSLLLTREVAFSSLVCKIFRMLTL